MAKEGSGLSHEDDTDHFVSLKKHHTAAFVPSGKITTR